MRHHEHVDAGRLPLLVADLDEAIVVLHVAGETPWRKWLQDCRDQIARGDPDGLDHLLQAFGGMGSFNDVVLSRPNASGAADELRRADDRLRDLRESIWRQGSELKHALAT